MKTKNKILLISNMYPSAEQPFYGIFVKNFIHDMNKYDLDINLVTIKGRGKSGIEKLFKYILFYFKIIEKVLFSKYDMIYIHYLTHSTIPFLFMFPFIRKPIIINIHGHDLTVRNLKEKLLRFVSIPILNKAKLVVVPSRYFKSLLLKSLQIEEQKIFVSPSGGIDTSIFTPSKKMKTNECVIGYVGRIDKGKGWQTLIRSVELVVNKISNIKVIIIGGGEEEKVLKTQIKQKKLDKHIEYIGVINHRELVEYYQKMNLFVFPTLMDESLGLVGLEAMACGVPVVGSNIGGITDYLIDDFNGYLFEVNNEIDLSFKIEKYFNLSLEYKVRMRENSISMAAKYDSIISSKELYLKLMSIIHPA